MCELYTFRTIFFNSYYLIDYKKLTTTIMSSDDEQANILCSVCGS